MSLYKFSINRVLCARQWSDPSHLQYQPSLCAKEHEYHVSAIYLNFDKSYRFHRQTDGRTDRQIGTRNSTRLVSLNIYIYIQ